MRRSYCTGTDVIVHQLIQNGDFSDDFTGWTSQYATRVIEPGSYLQFTPSSITNQSVVRQQLAAAVPSGHIVFVRLGIDVSSDQSSPCKIYLSETTSSFYAYEQLGELTSGTVETFVYRGSISRNRAWIKFRRATSTADRGAVKVSCVMLFDLTADFGAGNEPEQSVFEAALSRYRYLPFGENNIKMKL